MSNRGLYLASGFLRANLGLGIGRYVCQLQRVTLKFCKDSGSSRGIRQFVENDLVDYARNNPGIVVYLKPRRHRTPVIKAEYLNGTDQWVPVHNYTRDEIIKWMELLRTQMKDGTKLRIRKLWHTEFPSIQGPWTPFTFADTALNITKFPNEKYSAAIKHTPTATETVLNIYREQRKAAQIEAAEREHNPDGLPQIKVQSSKNLD